jgi:hypothetical protein
VKSKGKSLVFILGVVIIASILVLGCEETAKKTSLDLMSDLQQNIIPSMNVSIILPDGTERPLDGEPVMRKHRLLVTFEQDMTEAIAWVSDNFSVKSKRGEVGGPMDWWDTKTAVVDIKGARYGDVLTVGLGGIDVKTYRVAALGDVNGDGNADFIVGAPGKVYPEKPRKAYLFYGDQNFQNKTAGSADVIFVGEDQSGGDNFSQNCGVIGDINADGFMDIAIGAPSINTDTGSLYILMGGPNLQSKVDVSDAYLKIKGKSQGDRLGEIIAAAGDVDDDGYDDLLLGVPMGSGGRGAVYLFSGQDLTNAATTGSLKAMATFKGEESHGEFGYSVSAADVDGDGRPEILVGAPRTKIESYNDIGRVYVFKVSDSDSQSAFATIDGQVNPFGPGETPDPSRFGVSVSSAGDLDSDGKEDVIVGATGMKISNLANAGAVHVFFGSELSMGGNIYAGFDNQIATGKHQDDRLGRAVAGVGGFNGDEFSDFVAGAPFRAITNLEGSIQLILGGSSSSTRVLDGNMPDSFFGKAISHVGDFNGDGFSDFAVGSPMYNNSLGLVTIFLGNRDGFLSFDGAIRIGGAEEGAAFGNKMANQLAR